MVVKRRGVVADRSRVALFSNGHGLQSAMRCFAISEALIPLSS